ncbi:DUF4350 domain-containing protein [Natrarchaeobius chitinivorans]|uniref:DUF4350 domain-containing protein n=1 Tax=Natrarchaeobius chitinivorans TaxID=1679083 RepID=UPI001404BC00|nr:DUF4350 domain-containing protein [Natrarchaeobius chitinivorans]
MSVDADGDPDGFGFDLEIDRVRLLTYALTVAIVFTIAVGAGTSTAAFGPFTPSWEGTTELRERLADDPETDVEILRETTEYGDRQADGTIAFVVSPEQSYDDADATRVRRFVEDGGTLVVFDNFGTHGNDVLADVGADSRFDGRVVRDDHRYDGGPLMPIAQRSADHPYTAGAERLSLNYATAVDPGGGPDANRTSADGNTTVLFATSEFARLEDADGEPGTDDRSMDSVGPYPVATVESVGDGRVVAVGDPSLAVNAMIDREDNAAFLTTFAADGDRVYFDVSHAEELPPLANLLVTLRQSPPVQILVGFAVVSGIGLSTNRRVRAAAATARRRWALLVDSSERSAGVDDSRPSPAREPTRAAVSTESDRHRPSDSHE